MAIITAIGTQKRKGRYNVFLDGHYAFPISESTLIKFRLAKGQELDEEAVATIKSAEVVATANTTALDYLSHQPRTVHEVAARLREEDLPEAAITQALARLKDLGYLNDHHYAQGFINDNLTLGDKGPKVMTTKLRQKGVAPAVIDDTLATIEDAAWREVATRAATKAARQNARRPYREQVQRVKLALQQKGFDHDMTAAVVADLALEPDTAGEHDRLQAEAAKQWRLKHRYTGYDRRNRVKQALYRKGYQLDDITAVLAEFSDEDE